MGRGKRKFSWGEKNPPFCFNGIDFAHGTSTENPTESNADVGIFSKRLVVKVAFRGVFQRCVEIILASSFPQKPP